METKEAETKKGGHGISPLKSESKCPTAEEQSVETASLGQQHQGHGLKLHVPAAIRTRMKSPRSQRKEDSSSSSSSSSSPASSISAPSSSSSTAFPSSSSEVHEKKSLSAGLKAKLHFSSHNKTICDESAGEGRSSLTPSSLSPSSAPPRTTILGKINSSTAAAGRATAAAGRGGKGVIMKGVSGTKKKKEMIAKRNAYRAHSRRVRRMKEPELDVHYNMRFLEDMKNEFGSGDVVIMRGTERFSRWIQRGTFSHWSHIAMIIVDPDEELRQAYKLSPKFDDETVFVFESDTETLEPRKGGGCQMLGFDYYMSDCIQFYNSDFLLCWRKLVMPPEYDGQSFWDIFPTLRQFLFNVKDVAYEKSRRELVLSTLGWNMKEDGTTMFCSEIIAAAYKEMGLLSLKGKNSNNYLPRDWSSETRTDCGDINDVLLRGARLKREVRIRFRNPWDKEKVEALQAPSSTAAGLHAPSDFVFDKSESTADCDDDFDDEYEDQFSMDEVDVDSDTLEGDTGANVMKSAFVDD